MMVKKLLLLITIVLIFESCSNKTPVVPKNEFNLFKIEDILKGDNANLISLLNKVRGSVGKRGPATKTIWSKKNDYGLGLYISANHVYGLSGWASRNANFFDFETENLGIFETSQIPPINGNISLGNTLVADFPFIHFNIAPDATNTTILPEEDFYLGMIDNQRVEKESFPKYPNNLQKNTNLQMYDPNNRTIESQTWNVPMAGEKALGIGYPQDNSNYPNGAVIYGKILSDDEAIAVIQELSDKGDSEGDIPYRPEVEFLIEAQGLAGMSGGGVFNSEGQLLGIMVRSSYKINSPRIVRVVKIAFIRSKMIEFYNGLEEPKKAKIKPFIRGEL